MTLVPEARRIAYSLIRDMLKNRPATPEAMIDFLARAKQQAAASLVEPQIMQLVLVQLASIAVDVLHVAAQAVGRGTPLELLDALEQQRSGGSTPPDEIEG